MLYFVLILGSAAAGFAGGVYVTKSGYEAKLKLIADQVTAAERHISGEVRTFAARIKAYL